MSVAAERGEGLPLEGDAPGRRPFQARKDVEQGRFARPGGPPEEKDLSPGDIEVNPSEDLQVLASQVVGLSQPLGTELDRIGCGHELVIVGRGRFLLKAKTNQGWKRSGIDPEERSR